MTKKADIESVTSCDTVGGAWKSPRPVHPPPRRQQQQRRPQTWTRGTKHQIPHLIRHVRAGGRGIQTHDNRKAQNGELTLLTANIFPSRHRLCSTSLNELSSGSRACGQQMWQHLEAAADAELLTDGSASLRPRSPNGREEFRAPKIKSAICDEPRRQSRRDGLSRAIRSPLSGAV